MKMSSFKIMTKHTYKLSNNFWANNAMVLKVYVANMKMSRY